MTAAAVPLESLNSARLVEPENNRYKSIPADFWHAGANYLLSLERF
jgi:hypothetical protein